MKFDAERALTVTTHESPLAYVEEAWRESGWDVAHSQKRAALPLRRLSHSVRALLVVLGVLFGRFADGWVEVAGLIVAAWSLMQLTRDRGFQFRFPRSIDVLSATRPRTQDRCVLIIVRSARPRVKLVGRLRIAYAVMIFASAVGVVFMTKDWAAILVTTFVVMLQLLYFLSSDFVPTRVTTDNKSGLAFAAEFARTWPTTGKSADLQFAVIPADEEAIVDLNDAIDAAMVVVDIVDPGVSQPFKIAGDDIGLELAEKAASDLWIPFTKSLAMPQPGLNADKLTAFVRLDAGTGSMTSRFEPIALDRTAQLVREMTLRWGKKNDTA